MLYNFGSNQTFEAIANLQTSILESFREIPGAEPPINGNDSAIADQVARADPRFAQAMRERNIRDVQNVYGVSWTAGYFALPGTDNARVVRCVFYYGGAGENIYAHPVEGIVAHVDVTHRKILDWTDIDRNAPIPRQPAELSGPGLGPPRAAPAPLHITQPDGPGFTLADNEVVWQKWHFRFGMHPREGLVLYNVGYEDGGKIRSILYRGSLSEMVVPYGDPTAGWFFRNSFDAGELGLGANASPLTPGVDCPENCKVIDSVVADESGAPHVIPGAIALYERDGGLAWKHGDDARRARQLVLFYSTEVGNYQYGFDWIFHQDGTLETKVELTGIMAVKAIADNTHDPYGHTIAKNISAIHHQHFFSFRLDMDVDGQNNRVVEMNSVADAPGSKNPWGNAFQMRETDLRTERDAQRNLNLDSSRKWIVTNPGAMNALGHPVGYALLPGENAKPFAQPDAWVRKRARFLDAHLWVTPYQPTEIYAGGDYPNQSRGTDGLGKWAAANRNIDNKDVVLWYNLGVTHNPRPEDWPVMPTYEAGFKLVPWGFFTQNPAMDLTQSRARE